MEINNKQIVKAYSPGVGSISDLVQSLEELGWTRSLPEDQTPKGVQEEVQGSIDYPTYNYNINYDINGIWKLSNPNSKIFAELGILEVKERKYLVSMRMTNGTDYEYERTAILDWHSLPTYIMRHVLLEADKCIYGLTDKNHRDIYSANRKH